MGGCFVCLLFLHIWLYFMLLACIFSNSNSFLKIDFGIHSCIVTLFDALFVATLFRWFWHLTILALNGLSLYQVIDVGGKEFRFTWSREFGDLCDIYEERRSGEDENGLLVESGCAWRKLNVQRVLDESTKKHVKMRSEEAERKHKSRKYVI